MNLWLFLVSLSKVKVDLAKVCNHLTLSRDGFLWHLYSGLRFRSSALVATEKQNASVLLFPAFFICAQNKSSSSPPAGLLRPVLHLYMHCPWILSLGCLCYHLTTSLENRSPSCSFHCFISLLYSSSLQHYKWINYRSTMWSASRGYLLSSSQTVALKSPWESGKSSALPLGQMLDSHLVSSCRLMAKSKEPTRSRKQPLVCGINQPVSTTATGLTLFEASLGDCPPLLLSEQGELTTPSLLLSPNYSGPF